MVMTKLCETCGGAFERDSNDSYAKFARQRFCSRPCIRHTDRPPSSLSPKTRYRMRKVAGRRILEHRLIMERLLGRRLATNEVVHHKNGDAFDNRPDNLVVLSPLEHGRLHHLRHSLTNTCVICGQDFVPHKTKRGRKQTCGALCLHALRCQRSREWWATQQVHLVVPLGAAYALLSLLACISEVS